MLVFRDSRRSVHSHELLSELALGEDLPGGLDADDQHADRFAAVVADR